MPKILVIRGGALGDFILSLPVIAALQKSFPQCEIEILGYPRLAALAQISGYAQRIRSVDTGGLARFFGADSDLSDELCVYFKEFGQIVSFFYDPDDIFHANLRKAGARHILRLPHRPDENMTQHATIQFAQGLEKIGVIVDDFTPHILPQPADIIQAREILQNPQTPLIIIHPGSGSPAKNWPAAHWNKLLRWLLMESSASIAVVLGEADEEVAEYLLPTLSHSRAIVLDKLSLPLLAAALSHATIFIGHDSGVSHLAAAVGTPVISLFGPTNPVIWAPIGAQMIQCGSSLENIPVENVQFALAKHLSIR